MSWELLALKKVREAVVIISRVQTPTWECGNRGECRLWMYKKRNIYDKEESSPPAVSICDFASSRKTLLSTIRTEKKVLRIIK